MNRCLICMNALDEGVTLKEYLFEEDIICGHCRHRFIKNDRIYTYKNLKVHAFYQYDDFIVAFIQSKIYNQICGFFTPVFLQIV